MLCVTQILSTFRLQHSLFKTCLIHMLKYLIGIKLYKKECIKMDYLIYFRVLEHLSKEQKATLSDLVFVAGLNWVNNPIIFLSNNGFIKETTGDYKGAKYFELTDKGKELHTEMKKFYDMFDDMLLMLNKKKLKVKRFIKNV